MTYPSSSPPNRRRRRIVVAVAGLLLVSLVAWWYWPRGDARFVGKLVDADSKQVRDLRRNGFCFETRQTRTICYPWRCVNGSLEIGFDSRTLLGKAALTAQQPWVQRMTGFYPAFGTVRLPIVDSSTDEIALKTNWGNTPHTVRWHRIPE